MIFKKFLFRVLTPLAKVLAEERYKVTAYHGLEHPCGMSTRFGRALFAYKQEVGSMSQTISLFLMICVKNE